MSTAAACRFFLFTPAPDPALLRKAAGRAPDAVLADLEGEIDRPVMAWPQRTPALAARS